MEQPEDVYRKATLAGAAWALGGWLLIVVLIGVAAAGIFYLR